MMDEKRMKLFFFLKKLPKIQHKFCPVVWLLDADDSPVDEKRMRHFLKNVRKVGTYYLQ
jgi:hypothetical protein